MKNMSTDHTWVFHSNRFVDMRYKMQSVYHNYMQGFDWEPPAVRVCVYLYTVCISLYVHCNLDQNTASLALNL